MKLPEGLINNPDLYFFIIVLEYHRGKITVLDRLKLEKHSCECYVVVKRKTDRPQAYKALF